MRLCTACALDELACGSESESDSDSGSCGRFCDNVRDVLVDLLDMEATNSSNSVLFPDIRD